MDSKERDQLDRLLAPARLSGPEKERMFTRVAEVVAPRSQMRMVGYGAAAFATAAAVLLVFFLHARAPEFAARGASDTPALLQAHCAADCAPGDTLFFSAMHLREPAFFSAYALSPSGERVWYFPTATGEQPRVTPKEETQVLAQAVRVGAEQTGVWTLHLVLTSHPVSREGLVQQSEEVLTRVEQPLSFPGAR